VVEELQVLQLHDLVVFFWYPVPYALQSASLVQFAQPVQFDWQ
jgi:hypothetical protein